MSQNNFTKKYPASASWAEGDEWTQNQRAEVLESLDEQYAQYCDRLEYNSKIDPIKSADPNDRGSDQEIIIETDAVYGHEKLLCNRITKMRHDLKTGRFNGYCMTCGSVIINPLRVMLSASHECTACKEAHEVHEKQFASVSQGGYAHG